MNLHITGHAKARCRELGIDLRDVEYYVWAGRDATPEELSQIYNAKRRPVNGGEKCDRHIIYLKFCFVVKQTKKEKVLITVYNPEYLFRTPETLPTKNPINETIERVYKQPSTSATEHFAKRMLKAFTEGKKIYYLGKLCQVVYGLIGYEIGIYIRRHAQTDKFITKCSILNFEVKDDDSGNSEVCAENCNT